MNKLNILGRIRVIGSKTRKALLNIHTKGTHSIDKYTKDEMNEVNIPGSVQVKAIKT